MADELHENNPFWALCQAHHWVIVFPRNTNSNLKLALEMFVKSFFYYCCHAVIVAHEKLPND